MTPFNWPELWYSSEKWLSDQVCLVWFHPGSIGCLTSSIGEDNIEPFPGRLSTRVHSSLSNSFNWSDDDPGNFVVRLPFSCKDLPEIFGTGHDVLMTQVDELQIPEETKRYIQSITGLLTIQDCDRLLIYVDGSSDPAHRHHHPEFAEHFGNTDAWSFRRHW